MTEVADSCLSLPCNKRGRYCYSRADMENLWCLALQCDVVGLPGLSFIARQGDKSAEIRGERRYRDAQGEC